MPTIFEYLGIMLMFYSDEHDPIHIHAIYDGAVVKVSFFTKDGDISRTTYSEVQGKFPPAKMKHLKKLVTVHKAEIITAWFLYFVMKQKITKKTITKRL